MLLCRKWFDSSPWPKIIFYLIGMVLRTLNNLAPSWPLFLLILLDSSPTIPPRSLHPALTSFLSLPQMHYAFLCSHVSTEANASIWTDFPIFSHDQTFLPLIQIQLNYHLFSEPSILCYILIIHSCA